MLLYIGAHLVQEGSMKKKRVAFKGAERTQLEALIAKRRLAASFFERTTALIKLDRGKTTQAVPQTLESVIQRPWPRATNIASKVLNACPTRRVPASPSPCSKSDRNAYLITNHRRGMAIVETTHNACWAKQAYGKGNFAHSSGMWLSFSSQEKHATAPRPQLFTFAQQSQNYQLMEIRHCWRHSFISWLPFSIREESLTFTIGF
jgi:lambda repressor-like predicted transcriptional regulator